VKGRRGRGSDPANGSLERLRARIDELDGEILRRLGERYRVVEQITAVKQSRGDGVYVPARERAQLARLAELNRTAKDPIPPGAVEAIFGEILSASRALQAPVSVAYLGPVGTYSEIAARTQFGSAAQLVPVESIADVFRAVERGTTRFGIAPIENSTEGMVGQTLDLLIRTPVAIVGERELLIRHALMSRAASLAQVRRIVSHPQSLAQCREWLARNAARIPTAEVRSNAAAAAAAAETRTTAAIAGREAAERYGLSILADGIQDLPRNVTRFVVLGPPPIAPAGDKISVLFAVKNEAGRLFKSLAPLAAHAIDLCKIESRPMRGRSWEYVFFVDFRGDPDDARVRRALKAMERQCTFFKVLGAYPAAALPDGKRPQRSPRSGRTANPA
jgi:chorismate mutase / prephenate dehydratase